MGRSTCFLKRAVVFATMLWSASSLAMPSYDPATCFARGLVLYPAGFTATHEITEFMSNAQYCTECRLDRADNIPCLALITVPSNPSKPGYSFQLLSSATPTPCPCDPDRFWSVAWPEYKQYSEYTILSCFQNTICAATLVFDDIGIPLNTFEPFLSDVVAMQATFPPDFFAQQVFMTEYYVPTLTSERVPESLSKYQAQSAPPRLAQFTLDQNDVASYFWSFGCDIDEEMRNRRWVQVMACSNEQCISTGTRSSYSNSEAPPLRCRKRNECYTQNSFTAFASDIEFIKSNAMALSISGHLDTSTFSASEFWYYSAQCYADEGVCITTVAIPPADEIEESRWISGPRNCPGIVNNAVLDDYIPTATDQIMVTREMANQRLPVFPNLDTYNPCMYPSSGRDEFASIAWDTKNEFYETCVAYLKLEYNERARTVDVVTLWDSSTPPIGPAPSVPCYMEIECASRRIIYSRQDGIELVFIE